MSASQNAIDSQLKALRRAQKLTQAMLAARCGMLGWDIGENVITKIETGVRCVTDYELLFLAAALRVRAEDLLPRREKIRSVIAGFSRYSKSK